MNIRPHQLASIALRFAMLCFAMLCFSTLCFSACATQKHAATRGLFDAPQPQQADGDGVTVAMADAMVDESAPAAQAPMEFAAGAMSKQQSPAPVMTSVASASMTTPKPAEASIGAAPNAMRLMIYTGQATVLVAGIEVAVNKITAEVQAHGGYVENQNGDTNSNTANITYRIPAEHFFAIKKNLANYGQVLSDSVQAQDVTKQVFDIELRLENATQSRARLMELLKQAQKMEDILAIEAEIRRLTDEIESMKGQLRYYKDQISFSTLSVSLMSNAPPPTSGPRRERSRFDWINSVGPEAVLNDF